MKEVINGAQNFVQKTWRAETTWNTYTTDLCIDGTEQVGSSSDASDLYSGGTTFKSRLGHTVLTEALRGFTFFLQENFEGVAQLGHDWSISHSF
jgi:hypothetical protein